MAGIASTNLLTALMAPGAIAQETDAQIESEVTEATEATGLDPYSTQASDLLYPESELFGLTPITVLAAEPNPAAGVKQDEMPVEVPAGSGETISAIEVVYLNSSGQTIDGSTRPYIIIREFDLEPGDAYDSELASEGLQRVIDLDSVTNASLSLESTETPGEAIMIVAVQEGVPGLSIGRHFSIFPDARVGTPAALQGITRPSYVRAQPPRLTGFRVPLSLQYFNIGGNDQTLTFSAEGGSNVLGFDLTFRDPWIGEVDSRIGYAVNLFATNNESPTFKNGPNDIELANGDEPVVLRVGGGFEIKAPLGEDFEGAFGLTYQVVSIHDEYFGSDIFTEDEDGNILTFDGDGTDTLLTLNIATELDRRNRTLFPTSGTRFMFGLDQAIPVGDANISFTRIGANASQFIPINFIRVPETSGTLIFNVQAGTTPFDSPPPYEAFVLGGSSSVRGYGAGELGIPRNYVQGSVEYRFPFATLNLGDGFFGNNIGERVTLAGNVFFDAATGFGSDDIVAGRPGDARGKPGDGYGYGLGMLAATDFGLARLEFGVTGGGDSRLIFTIGDRF
ncbi:MAG: BamA/TamA family outer membrane protein [Elainellaceae cyanobacterium]